MRTTTNRVAIRKCTKVKVGADAELVLCITAVHGKPMQISRLDRYAVGIGNFEPTTDQDVCLIGRTQIDSITVRRMDKHAIGH